MELTEPQVETSREELVVLVEQGLSGLAHWIDLVAETDQDPSSRSGNVSRLKHEVEEIESNLLRLKESLKTSQ